jgi:hypothetical protein
MIKSRNSHSSSQVKGKDSPNLSRDISSLSPKNEYDISYQGILHRILINTMAVLLEHSAAKSLHNVSDALGHIAGQAESNVDAELEKAYSYHSIESNHNQKLYAIEYLTYL